MVDLQIPGRNLQILIGHHDMVKIFDPAATAISAIQNVSKISVSKADLKRMLAAGAGEPSHVRVLFGEVDLTTLMQLAITFDVSDVALARAYVHAREVYGAYNPEMDEFAAEMETLAPTR
jgi:hypothetical protein